MGILALALAFLFLGCSEHERDNPYDPDGVNFIGKNQKASSSSKAIVLSSSSKPATSSSSSDGVSSTSSSSSIAPSSSSSVVPSSSSSKSSSSSISLSSSSVLFSSSSIAPSSSSVLPSSSSSMLSSSSVPLSSSSVLSSSSSITPSSSAFASSSSYFVTSSSSKASSSSVTPSSSSLSGTNGTFTDSRDSKTYKWVKIGSQVWMAENLNYNVNGSKCYNDSDANCKTYGRLYKWATAKGNCPLGWHLPSYDELYVLETYIEDDKNCIFCAGKHLKAKSEWIINNGSDSYGFSALPGGSFGYLNDTFGDVNYSGTWWSASDSDSNNAYCWHIYFNSDLMNYEYDYKTILYSVRCLKD